LCRLLKVERDEAIEMRPGNEENLDRFCLARLWSAFSLWRRCRYLNVLTASIAVFVTSLVYCSLCAWLFRFRFKGLGRCYCTTVSSFSIESRPEPRRGHDSCSFVLAPGEHKIHSTKPDCVETGLLTNSLLSAASGAVHQVFSVSATVTNCQKAT
jgi:hypothetical protein